jgi:hypothetical protein
MKTIISTFFALLLSTVIYGQISGPVVWPGDLNNNGIVNEVDVLYWGSAFGATGSPRGPNSDTTYIGYPAPSDWAQFFNNGVNFHHADANGDGIVDDDDLIPIKNIFGLQNDSIISSDAFPVIPGQEAPPLYLTTQVNTFQDRKLVIFEVNLGDLQTPVDSFYGFSFRLHYDTLFAKNGLSMGLAPENWVQQDENDTELFVNVDTLGGIASVALTRKDLKTVSGSGTLMRGIIVVEDIVFTPERDTFTIGIDSVRLVGPQLFSYNPDPVTADVLGVVSSVDVPKVQNDLLRVYPNPVRESVRIELLDKRRAMEKLFLFNNLGQQIKNVTFRGNPTSYRMNVQMLPPGLYTVVAQTSDAAYSQKIIIN